MPDPTQLRQNDRVQNRVVGRGSAHAHHGEILQGMFPGPDGRPMRGLVTLPCPRFRSIASFSLDSGRLTVDPEWKWKARNAASLTLERFGMEEVEGTLAIASDVPPKLGMGSSTSDVVAAIRAVAKALDASLASEEIAGIAVQAETASDSTMFSERVVLFAQRDAVVLEDFGLPLPPLEVLSFDTGKGVDTLSFPPAQYNAEELKEFEELVPLLRRGIEELSPKLIGEVATASSLINQRHLPKPKFPRLLEIAERTGAVGVQVAHSGSVVGFLFSQDQARLDLCVENAQALLAGEGFRSWRFQTTSPPQAKDEEADGW